MGKPSENLKMKNLEDISPTANGIGASVRLSDYDWHLLYWVSEVARLRDARATNAEVLKRLIREPLLALYHGDKHTIDKLKELARERAAINPEEEENPKRKRSPGS